MLFLSFRSCIWETIPQDFSRSYLEQNILVSIQALYVGKAQHRFEKPIPTAQCACLGSFVVEGRKTAIIKCSTNVAIFATRILDV